MGSLAASALPPGILILAHKEAWAGLPENESMHRPDGPRWGASPPARPVSVATLAHPDAETRGETSAAQMAVPQNCELINRSLSEPLSFRMVCYAELNTDEIILKISSGLKCTVK